MLCALRRCSRSLPGTYYSPAKVPHTRKNFNLCKIFLTTFAVASGAVFYDKWQKSNSEVLENLSENNLESPNFFKDKQIRIKSDRKWNNENSESENRLIERTDLEAISVFDPWWEPGSVFDQWWESGRSYSEHQIKLHSQIQFTPIDSSVFEVGEASSNQVAIGQIIQYIALPLYKEPMPQTSSYRSDVTGVRVELGNRGDDEYRSHVDKVYKQLIPSREYHGAMHCVRVVLWTQLLSNVYEKLGKEKIKNPILLATAGAFHDVARESEGIDYWDTESSEALEKLLGRIGIGAQGMEYIQAIKDKDPKNGNFSSDTQRIVHDADCLDIIRVIGKRNFRKKYLCFYNFEPKQRSFCDQLVNEIGDFIEMTEKFEVRNYLEHHSEDFYGDLVRLIFLMEKENNSRFPMITEILQHDMENILKVKSTPVTEHLLSILQ